MSARAGGQDAAPAARPELTVPGLHRVRRYFAQHPVAMDALIMALYVLYSTIYRLADTAPASAPFIASYIALTVATTALLFWRRRRPLLVAAGTTLLLPVSVALTGGAASPGLALAFALYAVASARPPRVTWPAFAAALGTSALSLWVVPSVDATMGDRTDPFSDAESLAAFAAVAIVLVIALAIGIGVRSSRSRTPCPNEHTGASAPGEPALLTELTARRLGPVRRYFAQHPVVMDVVIMVLYAIPILLDRATDTQPANDAFVASTIALVVAAAALLFWRRRHPLLVAGVTTLLFPTGVALTGGTTSPELAMSFALYAVAAARPLWVSWSTLAAMVGVTAGTILVLPSVEATMANRVNPYYVPDRLATTVVLAVMLLIALSIGISVRNRRLHVADLVERANALARDRDQQARLARAAERARIAREMHDVVAHSLSVMIALADGAGVALERSPARATAALTELSATGRSALADMRRVLGVLDTSPDSDPDAAPLAPQPGSDLDELVERFRTAGLPVRATIEGSLPDDANLKLTVYRIVQEALTNTLRHATGTVGVHVSVTRRTEAVDVEVTDQGATLAVPPSPGTGRGLIGMRERAAVYGGTVDAGPQHGGWRVHASIPWPQEAS